MCLLNFAPLLVLVYVSCAVEASMLDICTASSQGQSLSNTVINLTKDEDLDLSENCRISSVHNLTIQGSLQDQSTIRCRKVSGVSSVALVFTNASYLTIKNVRFVGCGGILNGQDIRYDIYDNYSANYLFNFGSGYSVVVLCNLCINLTLEKVTFSNSSGYAFAAINLFGASLLDSILINGTNDTKAMTTAYSSIDTMSWRGILLLFVDCNCNSELEFNDVRIKNLTIDSNYANKDSTSSQCAGSFDQFNLGSKNNSMPEVGAMAVVFNQNDYRVSIEVGDSSFTNNTGLCYGAVLVIYSLSDPSYASLIFQECSFYANSILNLLETNKQSYIGEDITVYMTFAENADRNGSNCISITQSHFVGSQSNSFAVSAVYLPSSKGICQINMESIYANVSKQLLYVIQLSLHEAAAVSLTDLKMIGSEEDEKAFTGIQGYGLLTFTYVSSVNIFGTAPGSCVFDNLDGPVLVMQSSTVYLKGEITFSNIVASKWATGAAIMLQVDSRLHFVEPLHATFSNNKAISGGAIGCLEVTTKFCVLLYDPVQTVNDHNMSSMNITILFIDNEANLAGNSIYVDQLYSCSMFFTPKVRVSNVSSLYSNTFSFTSNVNNGLQEMSSTPYEVRICQEDESANNTECENSSIDAHNQTIYTYPGKSFKFCVIVVDEMQNPVYSSIYINPVSDDDDDDDDDAPGSFDWELGNEQTTATVHGSSCNSLNLTLYTSNVNTSSGKLMIYPYGKQRSLTIPVIMQHCPLGFYLKNRSCVCDELFERPGFICSIDQFAIFKNVSIWIGNNNGSISYSPHCPDRYCYHTDTVNTTNFNSQCKYNRTGVLCGHCNKSLNLSTVIGHPSCHECSNWWLLTIFLYAFICMFLVFILAALKLTITTGTINGIIIFANLLNFNTFYFLEFESTKWLHIFVSWINLDIGFPVCFFRGMTSLHSSLLGFFFPVYLWLTVLGLIFLSRHSQRISDLTSRSAVPVLATLIHLSYCRLLRLILDGMIFVPLYVSSSSSIQMKRVWYYDANLPYLDKERLGLFILTIISIVLFVIPYTVLFVGIKFFIRFPLVNKFRPFVDAACAPYKDKYMFWFGARLLLVSVSFSLYGFIRNEPFLTMLIQMVIILCFTIAQALILPYKNTLLNLSELAFLTDVIIILTISLYYQDDARVVEIATNIVMIPAIFLFLVVIGYHIYVYILREKLFKKDATEVNTVNSRKEAEDQRALLTDSSTSSVQGNSYSTVTTSYLGRNPAHYNPQVLRESLMSEDSRHDD